MMPKNAYNNRGGCEGEVIGDLLWSTESQFRHPFKVPYGTTIPNLNLNQRNLWHKAIALSSAKTYFMWGTTKSDLGDYKLSQTILRLSASILIMPMHTSIAELRRATSVNTSPPSQIMISPSASILMMPKHTTIAEMRRATSANTSPPSQIMISPSASILMMPHAYNNRGLAK